MTFAGRMRLLWSIVRRKQTLLLFPYMFTQGTSLSWTFGNFPTFITTGQGDIVKVFLAYGVVAAITSFGFGKLYDKIGSLIIVIPHFVLTAAGFIGLVLLSQQTQTNLPVLIVIGAFFGATDMASNTINNVTISRQYSSNESSTVFGFYRFSFCIGIALTSGLSAGVTWPWIMGWISITTIVAVVSFFFSLLEIKRITFLELDKCMRKRKKKF